MHKCGAKLVINQNLTKKIEISWTSTRSARCRRKSRHVCFERCYLKKEIKIVTQTMKTSYPQVHENFPKLPAPSFASVESRLYRARANDLPPAPKIPGNIKIRAQWALTNSGERFCLQKSND